ncbi:MAG: hypothetical protein VYD85_00325, partial [Pseudomonadota bacterium]|nr:hypothetical protein [Pseudomonadota bacterium]
IEEFGGTTVLQEEVSLQENQRYCDVHYLVARADIGTEGVDVHPQVEGFSLLVDGHWRAPDSDMEVPFMVGVDIAYGSLLSTSDVEQAARLLETPLELGPAVSGVSLVIRRSMATAFDGIEFANTIPRAIGRRILRNIVTKATIDISPAVE